MDFQVSIIGIILILAFYLPGYFFRRFYFSGFSTKQFGLGEWYDRFFVSIFLGMIIQFLTIKILRDNFQFNFDTVGEPINQFYNKIMDKKLPDLGYTNFRNTIFFLFLSMLFGSAFGFLSRNFIRITKLDVISSTFRFTNIWHYYFRGDIVKTKDFKAIAKPGKWVSTRADVLVDFEKDEKNILYSGIISQYDLSLKSDQLERIYLTRATRYSSKEGKFKPIPGDILILKCNRVLNINLSYDFIYNDKGRKHKYIVLLITVLVFIITFSPIIIIPYYLYGKIGFFRTFFGIIESLVIFLFISSAVYIASTKEKEFNNKYGKTGKKGSILVAIAFVFIFLILLKITLFPNLNLFQFHR